MRKIAASLNEQNEQDAFILSYLPDENVSSIIKDALQLYFQVETGQLQVMEPNEQPEAATRASGVNLDAEVVGALLSTMQRMADGIEAQTDALRNLRVVGTVDAASPAADAPAPQEGGEEREDPDDPLVRNFVGITASFENLEFNREQ